VNSQAAAVWASQSSVTDPGEAGQAIDALPGDLAALREVSSGLVFHYRAGGDFAENGVPVERAQEINARYADVMLARLLERGEPDLARERKPADRVVGCCRDATVLFLAMARHKGIPARARVGFAAYFHPGWLVDHEVAEVWDAAAGRWRLVEPELDRRWTPELNGRPVDWLDLADDQFVTGPRAWQAARAGDSDPGRHVVDPGLDIPVLRGWPYLAHNVAHDLAALNKHEMLLWDAWGMQLGHGPGPVPAQDAAVLDEICVAAGDPQTPAGDLAEIGERAGLRVPGTVTSFDPYGGPPRQVTLR
jgi:hypothetical protein